MALRGSSEDYMQCTPSEDRRPTAEIIAAALSDVDSEAAWRGIAVLHHRGTRDEFDAAARLARGRNSPERTLAARILGQLGLQRRPFHTQSVTLLVGLLEDDSPDVVAAAAVALAHRHDPRAVPHLLRLCQHSNAGIRHGVAVALGGHDRSDAIAALIRLSSDDDKDVRSWATLGLGSMTEMDDDAIRTALLSRAFDEDAEIRGEAIIGLARRGDPRALQLTRTELQRPFSGDWPVEAAEILGDVTLYEDLESSWGSLDQGDRARFKAAFDRAFEACSSDGKSGQKQGD